MADRNAPIQPSETPEDVATLYSWANLHGAKYRDFSASRALTREKARQRVQEAIEEERSRARSESEEKKQADARHLAEAAVDEEAKQTAKEAPSQQLRMQQATIPSADSGPEMRISPTLQGYQTPRNAAPMREDSEFHSASPWKSQEAEDPSGRPAWLRNERPGRNASPVPPAPEDTLQGSRDRLTSRWFALKSVFEHSMSQAEPAQSQTNGKTPVLAVFSLAGGVGKTSLVATLGRALSARGERVLLVDTATYGLLPFYFGARDQRPGVLRTFSPPGSSGDAPLQMLAVDPESLGSEAATQEILTQQIIRHSANVGRVIVDLATASGAITRRLLRMSPTVLIPVVPDLNSVISVSSIDTFFHRNGGAAGGQVTPYYVLSQFDASLPLHLDVREVLREQLGDRLLPLALRHAPAVSEALAEGMTVMDYAPNSAAAEDFGCLAGWLKNLAASAGANYRGVRWSER